VVSEAVHRRTDNTMAKGKRTKVKKNKKNNDYTAKKNDRATRTLLKPGDEPRLPIINRFGYMMPFSKNLAK